jgi:hypothetical protein
VLPERVDRLEDEVLSPIVGLAGLGDLLLLGQACCRGIGALERATDMATSSRVMVGGRGEPTSTGCRQHARAAGARTSALVERVGE